MLLGGINWYYKLCHSHKFVKSYFLVESWKVMWDEDICWIANCGSQYQPDIFVFHYLRCTVEPWTWPKSSLITLVTFRYVHNFRCEVTVKCEFCTTLDNDFLYWLLHFFMFSSSSFDVKTTGIFISGYGMSW